MGAWLKNNNLTLLLRAGILTVFVSCWHAVSCVVCITRRVIVLWRVWCEVVCACVAADDNQDTDQNHY